MKNRHLLLSLSCSLLLTTAAFADDSQPAARWEKYRDQGQQAFDKGQYKRALTYYTKAVTEYENSGQKDAAYGELLKRVARAYLMSESYTDALDCIGKADEILKATGGQDADLEQLRTELNAKYRLIDVDQLGKDAAEELKKHSAKMAISKIDVGSRVTIDLPDKMTQPVTDNPKVDQFSLEKQVLFDIYDDKNGTITVSNIKGLKIHSTEKNMWVNLLECSVKEAADSEGKHTASVTAGKMGVTKTVEASLPKQAFAPVDGLMGQVRSLLASAAPTGTTNGSSTAAGSSVTTNGSGTAAGSSVTTNGSGTATGSSVTTNGSGTAAGSNVTTDGSGTAAGSNVTTNGSGTAAGSNVTTNGSSPTSGNTGSMDASTVSPTSTSSSSGATAGSNTDASAEAASGKERSSKSNSNDKDEDENGED